MTAWPAITPVKRDFVATVMGKEGQEDSRVDAGPDHSSTPVRHPGLGQNADASMPRPRHQNASTR